MILPFLAFLFVSFIGGSINPIFVKLGTLEVAPMALTALRFVGATLVLLPFWYRKKEYIALKDIYKIIPFSLNIGLFSIAIQYTSVTMTGILYSTSPFFVAIFAHLLIKERISKEQILGLLIAIVGIFLLTRESMQGGDVVSFGTPLGNGLILLASAIFGLYPVGARSLSRSYSSLTIVFFSFATTAMLTMIAAAFEWHIRPFQGVHVTEVVTILLVLILISSITFWYLYQWLIKHVSAFVASLTNYGTVVTAAISGAIVFEERVTLELIIGAFLVVVGVFLATTYTQLKKQK